MFAGWPVLPLRLYGIIVAEGGRAIRRAWLVRQIACLSAWGGLVSRSRRQFRRPELGVVRLYRVGQVVVFPHTSAALRVAEPSDLVLIDDALAGDRLVALAAMAPGWEGTRPHRGPGQPVACLARIAAWSDGGPAGYNVLFWGVARLRILSELGLRHGVRQARVEVCEDYYPLDDAQRAVLYDRLLEVLASAGAGLGTQGLWGARERVPLGVLADMVAQSVELPWAEKKALLAECNVHRRAERLLCCLAALAEASACSPARGRLSAGPDPN